ncbi:putative 26S proteasome non-ATPase regulatory subunit 12 [Daphnia magna]|uniref:Putative 26S proteasome non-ATPase regulatory subunit 12 n=1 Tax=Daphnia magna TaxID=35525 RepID=A0A164GVM6_9CRUS|nr:putative 26S proteasome non-ATPase regulatory subunit 12 [Daphnia magna]
MLVHKVKTCECMENPEKEKVADEIPKYKELLRLFVIAEQINWGKLCQQYQLVLRAGDTSTPVMGVFTIGLFTKSHLWLRKNM